MNNSKLIKYLINLSFYLYFFILIVERVISVVLTFTNNINIFSNAFYGYIYVLVFFSVGSWLVYLLLKCRTSIKALFKPTDENLNNINYTHLSIASGLLLLSGMVHTEYTIPVIQFISYGILIIGILLKVMTNHKESKNKVSLWLSFFYLVAFSMAIPVMYHSSIELHILFHVLEAITSVLLVGIFTYLMIKLFNNEDNLFILWPIILAVVLDTALIILRWNEEINHFVLIFISLSLVLFLVGYFFNLKKTTKGSK